jgi:mitochondrial ATPase complex subunit ATP10
MAQELFIELLGSALRSPARYCLRRPIYHSTPAKRLLSYSAQLQNASMTQKAPPGINPQAKTATPGSNIPLHVGLDRNPEHLSTFSRIPIPKGERGEKFVPSPLARPLGLPYPPRPGQNTPIDRRTWSQKKEDFANYDKAMERRRILARSYLRPYFQEWKRVDHFKGKSFVSNERLFRHDKALYFPNMWGQTLSKSGDGPDGGRDTTNVLQGKISVVGIQSGQWAEEQVDTFVSKKENPQLQEIIESSGGLVQRADINIQGDWGRAMLVKLFKGRIRNMIPDDRWERYFLVRLARDTKLGLTDEIRDAMGFLNSQVGYVYLLDPQCRIRWAGSGHAWKGEVESLNAGVRRLLTEARPLKKGDRLTTMRSNRKSEPRGFELERKIEVAAA